MIRLTFIISFLVAMILFTIFIMHLGFKQGNMELLLPGLAFPLWIFLLFNYLKFINRVRVEKDFMTIRNFIFGQKDIYFKDIQHWEEVYTLHLFARNLLIKTGGKKIIVSNMIDKKNYKILHDRLLTCCKEANL